MTKTSEFDVRLKLLDIIKNIEKVNPKNMNTEYIKNMITDNILPSEKYTKQMITILEDYNMDLNRGLSISADKNKYKQYILSDALVEDVTSMLQDSII